jgi:chemotaxis protein MotB
MAIRNLPNPIRLEGHTDSIPIRNTRFHSNWELSAARSIAILELLSARGGVERSRMSIGGYADVAPVESNETPEGRARNRRVDIVILNENGQAAEPSKPRQ